MTIAPICHVYRLGSIPYLEAWQIQKDLVSDVQQGGPNRLLLLQHPPVYTTGRGGKQQFLPGSVPGAELHRVDRGGDVTFHGPGQLVAYPILNLGDRARDAARYVRTLEQVVIDTLADFGLQSDRISGRPGVWVDDRRKICAIGVRISRGVTSHGLALNVTTDLSWFDQITPCGIPGSSATSLAQLLPTTPSMDEVMDSITTHFATRFELGVTLSVGAGVRSNIDIPSNTATPALGGTPARDPSNIATPARVGGADHAPAATSQVAA